MISMLPTHLSVIIYSARETEVHYQEINTPFTLFDMPI